MSVHSDKQREEAAEFLLSSVIEPMYLKLLKVERDERIERLTSWAPTGNDKSTDFRSYLDEPDNSNVYPDRDSFNGTP